MSKKRFIFLGLSALLVSCAAAPKSVVHEAQQCDAMSENNHVIDNACVPTLSAHPDNLAGQAGDELWGEWVADPYRWLEDEAAPAVKDWTTAQDARARAFLNAIPTQKAYAKRLGELMYVASTSTPTVVDGKAFYFERAAKAEKSLLHMRDLSDPEAQSRVLLDPNTLSDDGSISIGMTSLSPDASLMAYTLKQNNADHATLYIMDVATGKNLSDKIEGARYAEPSWLKDNSGFYYTYFPTDESIAVDLRPGQTDIRLHKVGQEASQDTIVMPPLGDPTKFHGLSISRDMKWLGYSIQDGWNGNSLALKNAQKDEAKWIDLPGKKDVTYAAQIDKDVLYIQTNEDAPRYRIVKIALDADMSDLERSRWIELIPEDASAVIEDFRVINDKIVVKRIKDVINILDVYDLDGKRLHSVELPDRGSIDTLSGKADDPALYFDFSSYKIPRNILRLDMASMELSTWAKVETPAATDDVISEQIFATSKDGTKVPMFVLRHKDTPLDGSAPTIVYGYGGFNVPITPGFNPATYAWLERGGIYIFSNLRGGSEYGENWHRDGMGLKKQNVFDDYYAVAETLIANNYTSSKRLAAYGGSNGGLLVGAALTQRPDLYGAIVCAVPLLDMVRYHLFGSGRTWISEYNSVDTDRESFESIRAYSPYSNVKKDTAYPAVLFLGADSDDRVDPMHARKMTAAIQDATSNTAPVVLRVEKNSGHGGADLTAQRIAQYADIFAFLDVVLSK